MSRQGTSIRPAVDSHHGRVIHRGFPDAGLSSLRGPNGIGTDKVLLLFKESYGLDVYELVADSQAGGGVIGEVFDPA